MHELDDMVSQADIAAQFRTTTKAIYNWTTRYPDFPRPLKTFGAISVYSKAEIKDWYIHQFGRRRYDEMGNR